MNENETQQSGTSPLQTPEGETAAQGERKHSALVEFLLNILRGAAIGMAFIIPGFSGGSVAAILGVYEKLVGSVTELFKHFKRSILFLLPIALGMVLGIAALFFPIQWGLKNFPIPTVTLFVGLSLGGLPSVTEKIGPTKNRTHLLAFLLPCAAAASLVFLPIGKEVDLFSLNAGGYLLLVLIGAVGACALVVPGISGSMLLLIFGYYTPLLDLISKNLLRGLNVGTSVLVLALVFVGAVAGFFAISFLMKFLLKKFPRGTFVAILGFILGSVVAVYAVTVRNTPIELHGLYASPWYWIVAVLLLLFGAACSYLLYRYSKKK